MAVESTQTFTDEFEALKVGRELVVKGYAVEITGKCTGGITLNYYIPDNTQSAIMFYLGRTGGEEGEE